MFLGKYVEAYGGRRRQWQRPAGNQEGALRAPSHRARVHPGGDGHQSPSVSEQEIGTGDFRPALYANKITFILVLMQTV